MIKIESFVLLPGYETNTYLVYEQESKKAVLIDPAAPGGSVRDFIEENELDLIYILNTHGHSDHIGGNSYFKRLYPEARLLIHPADKQMLVDSKVNLSAYYGSSEVFSPREDGELYDGQEIEFGKGVIKVMHTPGHTLGGACFLIDNHLFSGDTLFDMSVGRSDLPGGSHAKLMNSIKTKIMGLPDDLLVYPGHGNSTTLGVQRGRNPFLKDLRQFMIIAIDGPAASGKSTTAKKIADVLGINYIDTGAMYRACALKVFEMGFDLVDSPQLRKIIDSIKIDFDNNGRTILLDGVDVSEEIRTDAVSAGASKIATIGFVREKMTELQREIGSAKSVVMDGRDIGSAVFPNADFKFYLDASVDARAKRRHLEAVEKKENLSLEEIRNSIVARDEADMNREISPLVKAEDAIEIDTSDLTISEQVAKILEIVGK